MAPRPESSCDSLASLSGAVSSGFNNIQDSDQHGNRVHPFVECTPNHHDGAVDAASVPSTGTVGADDGDHIPSQGVAQLESQDDTKVAAKSMLSAATELAMQRSQGVLTNPTKSSGALELPNSARRRRSSRLSTTTRRHSKVSTGGDKKSSQFVTKEDSNYDGDNDGGDDLHDDDDWSSEGSSWIIHSDDISINSASDDHPGAYRVDGPRFGIDHRRESDDNVSIIVGSNLHDDDVRDSSNARTTSIVLQGRTQSDDEASLRQRIHELEAEERRHSAVALEVVGMYIDPESQDSEPQSQEGSSIGKPMGIKVISSIGLVPLFLCLAVVLAAIGGAIAGILLSRERVGGLSNPTDASSASTFPPTNNPTNVVPTITPSASPTSTPTTTFAPTVDPLNQVWDILLSNNASDPLILNNPITPQHRAMKWLSNSTTGTKWLTAVDRVIERYVLAVLYFTWGGGEGRWKDSKGWLTNVNLCLWNTRVQCSNHGKNVEQLSLGTSEAFVLACNGLRNPIDYFRILDINFLSDRAHLRCCLVIAVRYEWAHAHNSF